MVKHGAMCAQVSLDKQAQIKQECLNSERLITSFVLQLLVARLPEETPIGSKPRSSTPVGLDPTCFSDKSAGALTAPQ